MQQNVVTLLEQLVNMSPHLQSQLISTLPNFQGNLDALQMQSPLPHESHVFEV